MRYAACGLGAVVLALSASVAGEPLVPPPAKDLAWIAVDCDAGDRLGAVLAAHRATVPLAIEFSGTCAEDVTVRRDDVSIRGAGPDAAVVGGITVTGASRVRFADFTVRESNGAGILAQRGASVDLERVLTEDNYLSGVMLTDSDGRFVDCTFLRNGLAGLHLESNSGGVLGGETVSRDNIVGLYVATASYLYGPAPAGRIDVSGNNGIGIGIDEFGSVYFFHVDAGDNIAYGVAMLHASALLADLRVNDNIVGISVEEASQLDIQDASVYLNQFGIFSDSSDVIVRDSSVQGNLVADVSLEFGSRGTFDGGNDVDVLTCDGTALSRGDATCPAAAVVQERNFPRLQDGIGRFLRLAIPETPGGRTATGLAPAARPSPGIERPGLATRGRASDEIAGDGR